MAFFFTFISNINLEMKDAGLFMGYTKIIDDVQTGNFRFNFQIFNRLSFNNAFRKWKKLNSYWYFFYLL